MVMAAHGNHVRRVTPNSADDKVFPILFTCGQSDRVFVRSGQNQEDRQYYEIYLLDLTSRRSAPSAAATHHAQRRAGRPPGLFVPDGKWLIFASEQ